MKAKKSLGQNWLKSESTVREIIKTAELKKGELVLEIGPGRGVLTEAILVAGAKVLAVEKDDRLISFLQEKFTNQIKNKKLILIHNDILDLNIDSLLTKYNIQNTIYKLVANIPYYITGQIIRKFLSEIKKQPNLMVLMMQKEVAKRIVASDKKESLLSISVKVYGEPKFIKTVPAGAFEPKPKVDSAILLIKNISRNFFKVYPERSRGEDKFFEILKKGFGQKRKYLKGNIGIGEEILMSCNISSKARAENLSLENWNCLAKNI